MVKSYCMSLSTILHLKEPKQTMDIKAMAKINLGLDVLSKRPDGYHEVRMVMQNIYMYDRITLEKTSQEGIFFSTDSGFLPADSGNLAYRAAQLLTDRLPAGAGVRIRLSKFIPVAAGMAGGSSDAAAVLTGMNRLFSLHIPQEELMELGLTIGADVPYCILRGSALAEGIGEKLTRLSPPPDCYILIGKPPIGVSTKEVYGNLRLEDVVHPDIDGIIRAMKAKNLEAMCASMGNVLETVTIPRYPVIGQIKDLMIQNGALTSLMSGSGPTVFGIFDDENTAEKAKQALKQSKLCARIFLTTPYHPESSRRHHDQRTT